MGFLHVHDSSCKSVFRKIAQPPKLNTWPDCENTAHKPCIFFSQMINVGRNMFNTILSLSDDSRRGPAYSTEAGGFTQPQQMTRRHQEQTFCNREADTERHVFQFTEQLSENTFFSQRCLSLNFTQVQNVLIWSSAAQIHLQLSERRSNSLHLY